MRLCEFQPRYSDRLSPLALKILTEEQDGLLLVGESRNSMYFFPRHLTCSKRTTFKTHQAESSMAETPCSTARSNYLTYNMHLQRNLVLCRLCDSGPPSVGISPARMLHSIRPFEASLIGALASSFLYGFSSLLLFISIAIHLYYCCSTVIQYDQH